MLSTGDPSRLAVVLIVKVVDHERGISSDEQVPGADVDGLYGRTPTRRLRHNLRSLDGCYGTPDIGIAERHPCGWFGILCDGVGKSRPKRHVGDGSRWMSFRNAD